MSDRTGRAVAAAVATARRHGLAADDPVVLHDGVNAVVHLRPAPVVARVATLTPLLREGERSFAREVTLAGALADAGARVVPPSDLLPPGPHSSGGLMLTFWRYVEVLPDVATPELAGRTLAELHALLAGLDLTPAGAPLDVPFDDLAAFVERGADLGADPALAVEAGRLAERLRPLVTGDPQWLHGDMHPGNLLATRDGWIWADLEDACCGPVAWDQACLRSTSRLDGRVAVDAMRVPLTDEELAPFVWLRRLHGAAWWFVHAVRVPGDLPTAHARLRTAVDEVRAGLAGDEVAGY